MSSARRTRSVLTLTAGALAAVLAVTGFGAGASAAEPPAPPAQVAAEGAGSQSVTLITGDVVTVAEAGGQRRAASVTPAEGRESVTFQTTEVDGQLLVLPSDAVPYVGSGALDDRLFDVAALIDDGYAQRETLPLLVRYRDPSAIRTQAITAASVTRPLESIDGAAWEADVAQLRDFWTALTPGDSAIAEASNGSEPAALSAGIAEVWLDGRVHATLEDSVAQIGGPAAWEAGLDGTGVDVAVLDTGIDDAHPDLTGRVAEQQDFSDSATGSSDHHGHGTHVASTIAGTGAASGGREVGVAYGADLLIGKVLGDDGSGYDSSVIAGMEWAAAEGAEIINMSLGGAPTDGTDPLSSALDRISEETGALFVVAAGNEGQEETVGAPGAADAALTVAAVDSDGVLAEFSSRGPRVGDKALKPDVSAPGVGIVAARAAETAMGEPVDEWYTAASGTSMATPHVAGAAALLRQQHPDWSGVDLKDALMSSSDPSAASSVWQQGVGEVDLTRAIVQPVRATGSADFARVDGDDVAERAVTYTNDGAEPIELTLTLDVRDIVDGTAGTAFAAPPTVTVPAGGSSQIAVTVDAAALERGRWSGHLIARASDGTVVARSAVGAIHSGPLHELTVTSIGFDGQPNFADVFTLFGDYSGTDHIDNVGIDEPRRLLVEEGTYFMHATMRDNDPQDEREAEIVDPELEITGDTALVLDARSTVPVQIRTPQPAQQQSEHSHYVYREFPNGRGVGHGVMNFGESKLWVTPTEPVSEGTFEFSSRWQMVRPSALLTSPRMDGSPLVNLLPDSPVFPSPRSLALVQTGPDFRDVRGEAALVTAGYDTDEDALVRAAAEAGAAALVIVRPADATIRTVFQPERDRAPIPAMVTTVQGGEQLAELARQGSRVRMDLRRSSPYLYDVQQVSTGAVPEQVVHEVTKANSHRIRTTYAATNATGGWTDEQRFAWRPWQDFAWNDYRRLVSTPSVREEWVSAGDSVWQHRVSYRRDAFLWGALGQGLVGAVRSYAPGQSAEEWHGAVLRSAGVVEEPSQRTNDLLKLRIPELVDAEGHFSVGETSSTAARLFRNDALVAESTSGVADIVVPSDAARYRLELNVRLDDPLWQWAKAVDTSWSFSSARPADGLTDDLPLLQVSYDPPVDTSGRASSRLHVLPVRITHPDGSPVRANTKVELSTDGGASWKRALGHRLGDTYFAVVPRGSTPVSVRVDARDGDESVRQTVIDAYGRR